MKKPTGVILFELYQKPIPKAKTWSRKGRCPDCNVATGSKHNKSCKYRR
jgi:hypothetical protein